MRQNILFFFPDFFRDGFDIWCSGKRRASVKVFSRFEGIPAARFTDDSDTAIWVPEQERITQDGSAIGNNTTLVFKGCYTL